VTSCVGTSFQNKLLGERQKRREDDEEDNILQNNIKEKRIYQFWKALPL